ncbi:hypothetical protein J4216_01740 [Candidatus Woesearchaeota archaeon]|nr:hypothetical protein [Candidatus Woesearchaeota archaeon]
MVKVGEIALKIAGRDAGQLCAVVDVVDDKFVLVDGLTRRKKCNLIHLEFLGSQAKIKKGAKTEEVRKALKEAGFDFKEPKEGEARDKKQKPVKIRKSLQKHLDKPEESKLDNKKESKIKKVVKKKTSSKKE